MGSIDLTFKNVFIRLWQNKELLLIGTLPGQIGTLPEQTGTMPEQTGTMPEQTGTMP